MNTRELSQAGAKRLPERTQAEVREVIDVLVDVIREELMEIDHSVYIQGLGRLHIEHHLLHASGIVRQQRPSQRYLQRLYFRFVPTEDFKRNARELFMKDWGE